MANDFRPIAISQDHTSVAALIHGSGIFGVVPPLAIWLVTRKNHPLINAQGIESLNFQIQAAILEILVAVVSLLLLGALFPPLFYLYRAGMSVRAAIYVKNNPEFRYPGVFTRWIPSPAKVA